MQVDPARIEEIFGGAVVKADAPERAAYLDQACGDDVQLRERVEALLAAHDATGNFLKLPETDEAAGRLLGKIDGPGALIGPYKLLEQIGEGGMGVVYMADQLVPVRRRVALKIIKAGMDTRQVIARFEAERQALALMDHSNISRVLDAGATDSGRPYFVMELVRGIPITDYCDQNNLPVHERLELFVQVCHAVQHAHQKGIIHRDLKPTNVLVTRHDGRAVPKVIDFGVAKATGQQLTEKTLFTAFAQMVGTPLYMSPEQAEMTSVDIDTRSDIYSLGVLLYELLTGTTPFDQQRMRTAAFDEIRRIIREEEPPKPSTRISTLGESRTATAAHRQVDSHRLGRLVEGDLDWIVMKALDKDRTRRYDTAGNFAADILRHLSDKPVEACPPSAAYRFRKFARRNKVALLASASIVAALFVGIVASTWQAIRATRAEALADTRLQDERLAQQDLKGANEQLASQLARAETAEQLAGSQARQLGEQLYEIRFPRAVEAFHEGQFAMARDHLNECPEAQRGWEWRWLAKLVTQDAPLRIPGRMLVQFMPDGSQVAAVDAADEKSVKLWNAWTGVEERTLAQGEARIKQLQMNAKGTQIATGAEDGTVALWDVSTGRQLWEVKAHAQRSDGFDFSADGTRLASVSWDGTLKVLSAKDGTELVSGHVAAELRCVSFHPDGQRIVTAGRNYAGTPLSPARVWDAQTGKIISELSSAARSATYSPDGRWIAAGGVDGTARIYDAQTGNEVRALQTAGGGGVAFTPDGSRLATATGDGTVLIWDLGMGKVLATLKRGVPGGINFLTFRQDGQRIAASGGNDAHIWDTGAAQSLTTVQVDDLAAGTSRSVWSVGFSPDNTRLVAETIGGEIKVFNTATYIEEKIFVLPNCREAVFSPDGKQIAASAEGLIVIWDAVTGEIIRQLSGHKGGVDFVAYSPDGSKLASCGRDATVRLWDAQTGAQLHELRGHKLPNGGTIWQVRFRPNGKEIVSAAMDGAKIWDVESGSLLHNLTEGDTGAAAYNPDGSRIVASGGGSWRAWDADSGEELTGFGGSHPKGVRTLEFSPDGSRLVSCDASGVVKLCNAHTGNPLLTLHEADGIGVNSIRFSPDGKSIAVAKANGTVLVWEIEPPSGGYGPRRMAQTASRVAYARLQEFHYSPQSISAIREDPFLDPGVKQLAIRLGQDRIVVVRQFAEQNLNKLRAAAEAPNASAVAVNNYAWELLTIQPDDLREPVAALPLAEQAVAMSGAANSTYLDTLAEAYFVNGEAAKAAATQQRAIDLLPRGESDRATYVERLKRFTEPLALLPETLERQKTTLGPDHADTLRTMHDVALFYRLGGQLDESIALFQETLVRQKATLGPDHPDTLRTMQDAALCFRQVGRFDEAISLFQESLKDQGVKLEKEHLGTMATVCDLTETYITARRYADAGEALRGLPDEFIKLTAGAMAPKWRLLAYRNGGEKHWLQAAALYQMLTVGVAKVDLKSDSEDAAMCYLEYAPVLVELDDRAGYERLRESAVSQFGRARRFAVGERLLTACLLWPANDQQTATLAKWAEVANTIESTHEFRCWNYAALALFEYRRGDAAKALEWAQKSLGAEPPPACRERAQILLAIAYSQLNRLDEARAELANCRETIESKFVGKLGEGTYESGLWKDWLIDRALLREADQALHEHSAATPE